MCIRDRAYAAAVQEDAVVQQPGGGEELLVEHGRVDVLPVILRLSLIHI